MIISEHEQRSEEWLMERLGLPTASDFEKVVTMKGKPSKTQRAYALELAGEIITGRTALRFVTAKMKRAIEREPDARAQYELIFDVEVQEVGICYRDELKKYGYSPDGLVGGLEGEGNLEIKDAEPHIQLARILEGWPSFEHYQQIQGGLFITDRKWCDLMSYCEGMEPLIIRFYRDEPFIKALEQELDDFCTKLYAIVRQIKNTKNLIQERRLFLGDANGHKKGKG